MPNLLQQAIQALRSINLDELAKGSDDDLRRLRASAEEVLRWTEAEQGRRDEARYAN